MLNQLRQAVMPVKMGLARPIAATGIPPNLLTLSAVPLSLGAAGLILHGQPGWALALALPAVLVDFVDGPVATLQGRVTPFGNLLESVVDRVVDAALLAGLAGLFPLAAASALGCSSLVSYVKARTGLVIVSDNHDWPGWGDRSERVALVLVSILLLALGWSQSAELALWLMATVSLVGAVQRLIYARSLVQTGKLLPYLRQDRPQAQER
ncbi:CDP-alcohol phosphatidyltransferase family protein [bacterium CPR1]|nr:CDP-alcohol phosphatidyltransferase family protein [bacterium CPR1]